jgi:hypothetical protein
MGDELDGICDRDRIATLGLHLPLSGFRSQIKISKSR